MFATFGKGSVRGENIALTQTEQRTLPATSSFAQVLALFVTNSKQLLVRHLLLLAWHCVGMSGALCLPVWGGEPICSRRFLRCLGRRGSETPRSSGMALCAPSTSTWAQERTDRPAFDVRGDGDVRRRMRAEKKRERRGCLGV